MKLSLLIVLVVIGLNGYAQEVKPAKTNFIIGLAGPELLHAGLSYRLTNHNLFSFSAGAGPSMGNLWPSLNLEHRLYFAQNSSRTNQKVWFFRQGTTFFPEADPPQQFTLTLTVGRDIPFKNNQSGLTVDGGVFYLPESERSSLILVRSLNLWPALRFNFYFPL